MKKFEIPEQAVPYLDALAKLVSAGVHAAVSLEASPLIDMPLVGYKTGSGAPRGHRALVFIQELEKVVQQQLAGNDTKKALCLFGLGDYAGKPEIERHRQFAKLYDKNATWDTVRREPLTRFLFTVYLALVREGERVLSESGAEFKQEVAHVSDSTPQSRRINRLDAGSYSLSSFEQLYNLPRRRGDPREFLQVRELVAADDGVETWRAATRWWGKGADEHPELTLFGPGELSVIYDGKLPHSRSARVITSEVRFPRPLKKDEHIRFVILRRHQTAFEELVRPGWQDSAGITQVTIPIQSGTVGIRFPESERPSRVWHYEDLPDFLIPGIAAEDNTLPVDASGFVSFSWRDLIIGLSYGIGWEW